MSKPTLILIGAGGHADACIDVIEQQGKYRIAGLVGVPEELNTTRLGVPVIATDEDLPELAEKHQWAIVVLGQIISPSGRIRLFQRAVECGFQMPAIVAPTAHVSPHATVGAGTIVMHGAIVNAGARVGRNCILNTQSLVEHGSTVGDHCHISTGTILNGDVKVGSGSFVGSRSVVKEGIEIGERCIVGLGLSVRQNLADDARYQKDAMA